MKQMIATVEVQPAMACPWMAVTSAHTTPTKPTSETTTPMAVIRRIGLTERLVMPLSASATILDSG